MARADAALVFTSRDIGADGFGHALNGFGGDLQARQQVHLLAALIERRLLAHRCLHTPHAGRKLGADDIEFRIAGKLPLMAVQTQIPGPRDLHFADYGQHRFRAHFTVTRLPPAWARDGTLVRHGKPQ